MTTLTAMPQYDAYKDSGEEWIAEIPEHWTVQKLKHIFQEKKHTQNMSLTCGAISFGQVIEKGDDKVTEATKKSYQEVLSGEFLINPLNLNYDLISLRIALSTINVVVSAGYIVLKNKISINKDYFKYLLHRYDVAYMKLLGSGVRQTISFNHIANSLLVIPPINEQTAIANFLDAKSSQIDKAIAIKEQQIALLNERKQILIQQAVTQGLDPTVPMKDSGVEWIGKIPEHWDIRKFKFLANVRYGLGQPPKQLDDGLKIIRATNVERGKIVENGMMYIDPKDIPWDRNPTLKHGEIIVVRSGAYTGDSALVTKDYDGCIAGYDMVATPISCSSEFLAYALLSHYVLHEQIYLMRMRSAQPHLNAEELNETLIALPPDDEQLKISRYIDRTGKEISASLQIIQKQIEKLKEYKTTLINSAVTGKIKVV